MPATFAVLEKLLFGNSLATWAMGIGVAAAVLLVGMLARRTARRLYLRMAHTDKLEFAEIPMQVVARTSVWFLAAMSMYAGFNVLDAPHRLSRIADSIAVIAAFWQTGLWITTAMTALIDAKSRQGVATDKATASSLGVIAVIARAAIWCVMLLLTLDNLGVNITTLVAGLGIGGVAVALALQNILGDLFASLSITLDRPFMLGDFLVVEDILGSVEHIGIKTTRLRSLGGEQIIMSNSDLLKSRTRNYGRMTERRVVFGFGIVYGTLADDIESIPALVRKLVEAQDGTRFDRCHFVKYGASSLDFETVFYVLSPDYNRYMDIQQAVNLSIYREFERRGIDFAYPTQTLYMARQERVPNKTTVRASASFG